MIFHTIAALGVPFVARIALAGAAKYGWMPDNHYLKQVIQKIREQDIDGALRILEAVATQRGLSERMVVAIDLCMMTLDNRIAKAAQAQQALRTEAAVLQTRRRALRKKIEALGPDTYRPIIALAPSLGMMLLYSTTLGVLAAGARLVWVIPEYWVWLAISVFALPAAFLEVKHMRRRRRMLAVSHHLLMGRLRANVRQRLFLASKGRVVERHIDLLLAQKEQCALLRQRQPRPNMESSACRPMIAANTWHTQPFAARGITYGR